MCIEFAVLIMLPFYSMTCPSRFPPRPLLPVARVTLSGRLVPLPGTWRVSPISAEEMRAREKQSNKGPHAGRPPSIVQLAVARCLGDYELKVPVKLVSSTPDVGVRPLGPEDAFLVLGCDGVWDVSVPPWTNGCAHPIIACAGGCALRSLGAPPLTDTANPRVTVCAPAQTGSIGSRRCRHRA